VSEQGKRSRTAIVLDFGWDSLRVTCPQGTAEIPIEHSDDGRLTAACSDAIASRLETLLGPRRLPVRGLCLVSARGVSLRAMSLPPAPPAELERLITLQLEKELPLPLDRLAWTWRATPADNGAPRRIAVAALRREVLDDYTRLLTACRVEPTFRLAALERAGRLPTGSGLVASLHVGKRRSELLVVKDGTPAILRTLPGGSLEPARAARLVEEALQPFERNEAGSRPACRVFLSGDGAELAGLTDALTQASQGLLQCATLELDPGAPAAGSSEPFLLQKAREDVVSQPRGRWRPIVLGAAGLLLVGGFLVHRYVSPWHLLPKATERLAVLEAERRALPQIDEELTFLEGLSAAQPAYLSLLAAIAEAAPKGTLLESLALNRQGEAVLRGSVAGQEMPNELRKKLAASPWFTGAVLDEQSAPQGDSKRVTFRIRARIKAREPGAEGGSAR